MRSFFFHPIRYWECGLASFNGILAAAISDVGRIRENNEDNYLLDEHINASFDKHSFISACVPKSGVAGVFDGMGGGEAGEQASLHAAQSFLAAASGLKKKISHDKIDRTLRNAFQSSNNGIIRLNEKYKVLGTTGTVVFCGDGCYKIYHLGDSRAYLFRNNVLSQLTRDQTLAQMKTELGFYNTDSPVPETEKHQLTEYIGRDRTGENLRPVESKWNPLIPGDTLLLCSDGLYDCCSDSEIAGILIQGRPLNETAEELVKVANANGGVDNCTAVLLRYKAGK